MVRTLLEWPLALNPVRADIREEVEYDEDNRPALVLAAENDHVDVMKLLLEWPHHAPRADCDNGRALLGAVECGAEGAVKLLLDWPHHAPRATMHMLNIAVERRERAIAHLLVDRLIN